MEPQESSKSTWDETPEGFNIIIGAVIGFIAILVIIYCDLSSFWTEALIFNIILSFIVGILGNDRKIGFMSSFIVCLCLSPLIGGVIALSSPRLKDEEYKEKMLETSLDNNEILNSQSVADQLFKLNELRKDGALTEDEFTKQKEKLLAL